MLEEKAHTVAANQDGKADDVLVCTVTNDLGLCGVKVTDQRSKFTLSEQFYLSEIKSNTLTNSL